MKEYYFARARRIHYVVLSGDILLLIASLLASYVLRAWWINDRVTADLVLARVNWSLPVIAAAHVFFLYLFDLYDLRRFRDAQRQAVLVAGSILAAALVLSGVLFFFPKYVFGRQVFLSHVALATVLVGGWRWFVARRVLAQARPVRLALVGDGDALANFARELFGLPDSGYTVTNLCVIKKEPARIAALAPHADRHSRLGDLLEREDFDTLAFDATHCAFTNEEVRRILELKQRGKGVYSLPMLYKSLTGKVPLTYIDGRWLLDEQGFIGEGNVTYRRMKRVLDAVLAACFLVVFSPLMLVLGLAVRMDSRGPALFVQERLGEGERPFYCLKFRTMRQEDDPSAPPQWAGSEDHRITRLGRILRKTRLDELPQLVNVLRGDMSFSGPRPIREHFAKTLTEKIPFYRLRFAVKPGLSGWAQVNYDYGGSEEGQLQKFQYELFYIQNMSLFLDLLILVRTVHKMLRGGGGA